MSVSFFLISFYIVSAVFAVVPVVEWDATTKVCPKWDGAHHGSTVEQLTSLTRRSLGENGKTMSHDV